MRLSFALATTKQITFVGRFETWKRKVFFSTTNEDFSWFSIELRMWNGRCGRKKAQKICQVKYKINFRGSWNRHNSIVVRCEEWVKKYVECGRKKKVEKATGVKSEKFCSNCYMLDGWNRQWTFIFWAMWALKLVAPFSPWNSTHSYFFFTVLPDSRLQPEIMQEFRWIFHCWNSQDMRAKMWKTKTLIRLNMAFPLTAESHYICWTASNLHCSLEVVTDAMGGGSFLPRKIYIFHAFQSFHLHLSAFESFHPQFFFCSDWAMRPAAMNSNIVAVTHWLCFGY